MSEKIDSKLNSSRDEVSTAHAPRLGAIHTVVFAGFAAKQLAVRIDDCTPKIIVAASCGIEAGRVAEYKPLVNEALSIADSGEWTMPATIEYPSVLQDIANSLRTLGLTRNAHEHY